MYYKVNWKPQTLKAFARLYVTLSLCLLTYLNKYFKQTPLLVRKSCCDFLWQIQLLFLLLFCLFNQGRISQDYEHFLIAPYGMMHHEVTASSLVKVDMRGDILDLGSTTLGANKTGFSLHSAIYASRPDVKCIIHVRSTSAVSVRAVTSASCIWQLYNDACGCFLMCL